MKSILFISNYPSPYRVDFFNELGKYVELTVLFSDRPEEQKHRSGEWFNNNYCSFNAVFLEKKRRAGSITLCTDVFKYLKRGYDHIILGGYSTGTLIAATEYLRLHRIPFILEVDGGLIRKDSALKRILKRKLIASADTYFSTSEATDEYLRYYGANGRIVRYPLTTLFAADILPQRFDRNRREELREKLGIKQAEIAVSVGQFIYRKGYDVLLKAAAELDKDTGIYIIGAEATEEYLKMRDELGLSNVHFVGFKKKEQLLEYYDAADMFVLPTREDVWGLVVNEAMARGLPVVTTDKCVAGQELVKDGENGWLVPTDRADLLAGAMKKVFADDMDRLGQAAIETVRHYTIEEMAAVHVKYFEEE